RARGRCAARAWTEPRVACLAGGVVQARPAIAYSRAPRAGHHNDKHPEERDSRMNCIKAIALLAAPACASAATVNVAYHGVIDQVSEYVCTGDDASACRQYDWLSVGGSDAFVGESIQVGDTFAGSFSYDSVTAPSLVFAAVPFGHCARLEAGVAQRVPEPSTWALLLGGVLGLAARARRPRRVARG